MDKNCFLLRIDNEITGNYKKLNCITFEVMDGSVLVVTSSAIESFTLKAEGCTFSQTYLLISNVTECTFTSSNYNYYDFKVKGNGKITVSNKYNLGYIIARVRNIDFSEFITYRKDIKKVNLTTNTAIGSLDTIFENCSNDLDQFNINMGTLTFVEGNLSKIINFKKMKLLACTKFTNEFNINDIKDFIELKSVMFYDSINFYGDIELLASDLYNNGKTTGTIVFYMNNTPNITIPSIISIRDEFYCTFSEDGYTFLLSKPNT